MEKMNCLLGLEKYIHVIVSREKYIIIDPIVNISWLKKSAQLSIHSRYDWKLQSLYIDLVHTGTCVCMYKYTYI